MLAAAPDLVAHRFALWTRLDGVGAASFDASGRLLTMRSGERFLRRGLDGSFVEMRRDVGGPWPWAVRRMAAPDGLYRELGIHLERSITRATTERAKSYAERSLAGLADDYAADARAFHATVGPVPIVPPNHARSVVVRLTEGCQYNACKFCTLYADTRFRVRPNDEFRTHVREVLDYFGDGAGMRPSLWVGDASCLEATAEGFADALRVLHEEVRVVGSEEPLDAHLFKGDDPRLFEGVYSFADVPRAARLERHQVEELRRLGVRRLYLGVETGNPKLLRQLAKPHTSDQVVEAVARLHAGGIAAGIILLVGAGGRDFVEPHLQDTAAMIGRIELHPEDFIFLSPLDTVSRETRHPVAGDEPLDDTEVSAETRRLRCALKVASGTSRVRIADYQLESFVY